MSTEEVGGKEKLRQDHLEHQILWEDVNPQKLFAYTMLGTSVVDFALYPIDVVRTRLQVQGLSMHKTTYPLYNSTLDAATKLWKFEGTRGLWKGFVTCEAGYAFSHTLYFVFYEVAKQRLQAIYSHLAGDESKHSNMKVFATTAVAGGIADFLSGIVWVPFDVATQRLQIQGHLAPPKYKSGPDCFKQVFANEGIRGLYRGFGATIIRNVPSSAVWWSTYELTKSYLHTFDLRKKLFLSSRDTSMLQTHTSQSANTDAAREVENEDPLIHLLAGVTAAVVSTTLLNPLDVAKTRLQAADFSSPEASSQQHPNDTVNNNNKKRFSLVRGHNIFSIIMLTIRQEGVVALVSKGLLPALLIATPYSVASILIYEQAKKLAVWT